MEPPCGQSIVKCEKQKDDGRMETQKRKQNEKEKAERRMKIVAGLGSVDEYIPYVQEGADELFCGYVPYNWIKKYGTVLPLNRREVLAYNVQLGSFSELEILSAMIRKYRKPVHIAMNSLYYIPEQYCRHCETVYENRIRQLHPCRSGIDFVLETKRHIL